MCVNGASLFYFGEQVQNRFEVAAVSTVWKYAVQNLKVLCHFDEKTYYNERNGCMKGWAQ